eukprot:scaffold92383_cov33-Cyclotella_meneghiniana.AAC.2
MSCCYTAVAMIHGRICSVEMTLKDVSQQGQEYLIRHLTGDYFDRLKKHSTAVPFTPSSTVP